MTNQPQTPRVKELAGGWITERVGTEIPLFLKLTYIGFCLFGISYLFLYKDGEVGQASRGPLVKEMSGSMDAVPGGWVLLLAIVLLVFTAGLLWYAFLSPHEEE